MSSAFVDTSALYACVVRTDRSHARARETLELLERDNWHLVSSSFVLLETVSLLQARLGGDTVRRFHAGFGPVIEIVWVDEPVYERSMAALLASGSRGASLTDWISFEVMRARGLDRAFAFDPRFAEQGFRLLPG